MVVVAIVGKSAAAGAGAGAAAAAKNTAVVSTAACVCSERSYTGNTPLYYVLF